MSGFPKTKVYNVRDHRLDAKLVSRRVSILPRLAASLPDSPTLTGARVEVSNISKLFKTSKGLFKAVDGVTVTLEPGTITALLGPSGSGKTTLLRLIAGLETPSAGNIFFDGTDVTNHSVQERDLGIVFQGYALFKHMNVAANVGFGPRIRQLPIDVEAKVQQLLKLIELEELGGRYPPQLSGGQKQRVAVARALACDPRVLLLDEPFGALDPVVRKSLRSGLKSIVKRLGVTTIIVTHDQEEAWDLADVVAVFNKGRIEQVDTPQGLSRSPVSPFVMDFVGDTIQLPSGCLFLRKMGFNAGGKSHAMLRPADLQVLEDFTQPYVCGATVADKLNVGWALRYWLCFDDDITVELAVALQRGENPSLKEFDVGQRVAVRADPRRMMAFDYEDLESFSEP
jgi:sulfate transport system ATP-binding protein